MSASSWGQYSNYRSMYECVDSSVDRVHGGQDDIKGAAFFYVSVSCRPFLHCPPYKDQIALSCVVCSK